MAARRGQQLPPSTGRPTSRPLPFATDFLFGFTRTQKRMCSKGSGKSSHGDVTSLGGIYKASYTPQPGSQPRGPPHGVPWLHASRLMGRLQAANAVQPQLNPTSKQNGALSVDGPFTLRAWAVLCVLGGPDASFQGGKLGCFSGRKARAGLPSSY